MNNKDWAARLAIDRLEDCIENGKAYILVVQQGLSHEVHTNQPEEDVSEILINIANARGKF
jgi:hypothetical protein